MQTSDKNTDKKRSANYTKREKETILSLVEKYLGIIENKKTNQIYNRQKNECWKKIAHEYNALQISGLRTGEQLKSCYEQMKKVAKQHKSEDKVELLKTGGGIFTPKTTGTDERVLNLLKDNYFSLDNEFDSNCTYVQNVQSSVCKNSKQINSLDNTEEIITLDISEIPDYSTQINDKVFQNNEESEPSCSVNLTTSKIKNDSMLEQPRKVLKVNHNIANPENYAETSDQVDPKNEESCSFSRPDKKRKRETGNIQNKGNAVLNKKLQVLDMKIDVLQTIAQVETEHLKTAKLETDIKKIVKEKENIELQLKKIELNKLMMHLEEN